MDSFYRNSLLKNRKENEEAKQLLNPTHNLSCPSNSTLSLGTTLSTTSTSTSSTLTAATSSTSALPTTTASSSSTMPLASTSSTSNENLPGSNNLSGEQFSSNNQSVSDLFYENDKFQMFIEKTNHIKQIKFRLQDHLFHMKIQLKRGVEAPLMRDILNFLQIGFNHILTNIKKFYKAEDHNIAFLTLYQEPMINGLNTGGFDIQESSLEMVERVLKMLEQFLVSNQLYV